MQTQIPKLVIDDRDREYKKYSYYQISEVVKSWLFNGMKTRDMDREILNVDDKKSKGFQSMQILHYLGLKENFQGIFKEKSIDESIEELNLDYQDFSKIIEIISHDFKGEEDNILEALFKAGEDKDRNFKENFAKRLADIKSLESDKYSSSSRKEQAILRAMLFKDRDTHTCALCHKELPVNLMVTAHIKPRSKCSFSEKKDPNIVMPVCKVGCDDLFEKGYIFVNEEGYIKTNDRKPPSFDLKAFMNQYINKRCLAFNNKTKSYFFDKNKPE